LDYELFLYVDDSHFLIPHATLKYSEPLGLGLFTSIAVPKHKYIARFYGTLTPQDELPLSSSHKVYINQSTVLDCTLQRYAGVCMAAMANSPYRAHTSTLKTVRSNCRIVVRNHIAYLLSTKDIMEHDEILLSYGKGYVNYDRSFHVDDYWHVNKRCLIEYNGEGDDRTPYKVHKVDVIKLDGAFVDIRRQVRKLDVLSMGYTLCSIRDKIKSIFATTDYQNIEAKFKTGSKNNT
jgi:hypothetical protein